MQPTGIESDRFVWGQKPATLEEPIFRMVIANGDVMDFGELPDGTSAIACNGKIIRTAANARSEQLLAEYVRKCRSAQAASEPSTS